MTRPDHLPHLTMIARTYAASGQPATTFGTLDTALGAVVGHKRFTILLHHAATREGLAFATLAVPAYLAVIGARASVR